MKALCVRQPHAELIVTGEKTVEVRTWRTNYRGRLAICAGARPDFVVPGFDDLPLGCVVGSVDLVDCAPLTRAHCEAANMHAGDWRPDLYAWILRAPEAYSGKLRPVKGRLGIFELREGS